MANRMSSLFDRHEDLKPADEHLHQVRLSMVSGVGPKLRQSLLQRFGSASAVLAAAPSDLRDVPGIGTTLARKICLAPALDEVAAELESYRQAGVTVAIDTDDCYPRVLREIHDPPGVYYMRGEILPGDALAVAIVGTRHATPYGLNQAERLAGSLARAGLTIVSGLARGIDAAAHRGALAAGGRTIAVLGGGVLNIYPPEHVELAAEVARCGAVISETPPRFQPLAGSFPQRNRLISGLSLGVLVIEAADRSGALITARHAMEQGREVFAMPGRVDSRVSRGCHRLLRDGAKLVESADDVLEELGPLVAPASLEDGTVIHHPAELQLNEQETQVLQAIGSQSTSIDALVQATRLPVQRVLATISVLEMRRLVRRTSGQTIVRL
jgi:DNA processing protein